MNIAIAFSMMTAIERQESLWHIGAFELAMLIAGGIITIGMIVAFVVIFVRKVDQQDRPKQGP